MPSRQTKIEWVRSVYNRLIYGVLRIGFAGSRWRVFPDANGWTLTLGRGGFVYKFWRPLFLFHPSNSFAGFKRLHLELERRGAAGWAPPFEVRRFSVRYAYIAGARDLRRALLEAPTGEARLALLREVLKGIAALHAAGIVHNDCKPKNVLVGDDDKLYFIDFENAYCSEDAKKQAGDYHKMLPRIIYFFTADEVRALLATMPAVPALKKLFEAYLQAFDIRALLRDFSPLRFEHAGDAPGEDIDVSVLSYADLLRLRRHLFGKAVDHFAFFRSRGDVKLFVYTLAKLVVLDVHLATPLGRYALRRAKLKEPSKQLALAGPDGSGKTTLLEGFVAEAPALDARFSQLPMTLLHAARFDKGYRALPKGFSYGERALNKVSRNLFTRCFAYRRLLRATTYPVILFDRSFIDPLLRAPKWAFGLRALARPLVPAVPTLLLCASAHEIAARKAELTLKEIDEYYRRAHRAGCMLAEIDAHDAAQARAAFAAAARYIIFTDRRDLH
jgi:hypothetical protein